MQAQCFFLHFLLAVWLCPAHIQLQHPRGDRPYRSEEAGGGNMGANKEAPATTDWSKDGHKRWGTILHISQNCRWPSIVGW